MVVKCPNCGQQVRGQPGQSGPCPKCGTRFKFPEGDSRAGEPMTCPHCGQKQQYRDGRCISCGKALSGQTNISKGLDKKNMDICKKAIERTGPQRGCLSAIGGLAFFGFAIALLWIVGVLIFSVIQRGANFVSSLDEDFYSAVKFLVICFIFVLFSLIPEMDIERKNKPRLNQLLWWIARNGEEQDTFLSCSKWLCLINENRGTIYFFDLSRNPNEPERRILFREIVGVDVLQNNSPTVSIGGAVAGAVLAGGVGAVIGAGSGSGASDLKLVFYLNNIKDPSYLVALVETPTKTNSKEFQEAQEFAQHIVGLIKII